MSEPGTGPPPEVPTFSECVLGYRAWRIDAQDRLWPVSDRRAAWLPGVNTARCNCAVHGALSFDWSWRDGKRVLEPHPPHPAPGADCVCGLYSWRRPRRGWQHDPQLVAGSRVCGAVASWGHLQVHDTGFRAEHACVVTLAYPPDVRTEALERLRRVAAAYRVDLVALDELQPAASRHGSPLPDSLRADPGAARVRPAGEPGREPGRARARVAPRPRPEPIPVHERIALVAIFVSVCLISCGSWMWHGEGTTGWVGLWLVCGGAFGLMITMWALEPHHAVRHAGHHLRHHAGRVAERARRPPPAMSDAEFEAVEDALDALEPHESRV